MLDRSAVLIVVSAGALIAAIVFLAALAVAGRRRSVGLPVGPRLTASVTFLGGIALGTMLLVSADPILALPILGAILVLELLLLQRWRIREAGWLLAGAAAPWTVLYAFYLAALYRGSARFDFFLTWLGFIVGALPMLLGMIVAVARRLPGPLEAASAKARSQSPARRIGDVGRAVLAPSAIGPFGLPEVGLLVGVVTTLAVGGLALPNAIPWPVRIGLLIVLSALVGSEAWLRSMPAPARRAFEALSWLGEWEIAEVRRQTGAGVPTTQRTARQWLLAHPERPEERWLRVEILILAGQLEEARAVAGRMPTSSPAERFDRAAAWDVADWYADGDGDIEAMEASVRELDPTDEEARLRGEVAIAVARVRRLVAQGIDPVEAGAPLRAVRERLRSRADGQLRRALQGRLFRALLVTGVVVTGIVLAAGSLLPFATI